MWKINQASGVNGKKFQDRKGVRVAAWRPQSFHSSWNIIKGLAWACSRNPIKQKWKYFDALFSCEWLKLTKNIDTHNWKD